MVDTNKVASAIPYDGLIAVGDNPYGANAELNAIETAISTKDEFDR